MTDDKKNTYDSICFTDLAYEFDFTDQKKIEKKIKARLKYHKLGDYNQERVNYIRKLKNKLYAEILKNTKSKYFQKTNSNYTELDDFNAEEMISDYHKKYGKLDKNELTGMIDFAIYLYHIR